MADNDPNIPNPTPTPTPAPAPEPTPTPEPEPTPGERTVPESRLRGIIAEKEKLARELATMKQAEERKRVASMSEEERLKHELSEKDKLLKEAADKATQSDMILRRAAIKAFYGGELVTPRAVNLFALDMVEFTADGELTEDAQRYLRGLKTQPEFAPLFKAPRPGGNSPAPGDQANAKMTAEQFAAIARDPKATPQQKQAALDKLLAARKTGA